MFGRQGEPSLLSPKDVKRKRRYMRPCIAEVQLYVSFSPLSWFRWIQTRIHMSHLHTSKTLIRGTHISHVALC